jgi:hypothetical protein
LFRSSRAEIDIHSHRYVYITGFGVNLVECLKGDETVNNTQALRKKLCMAALIIFLALLLCLPSVVKAVDLPPVDPPPEDDLPITPIDDPVSSPPPDEWVTWPLEQPGIVRPIKEPTGPIHITVHHKNNNDSDNNSTGYRPGVNYSHIEKPFAALQVNDRSSYVSYNSLVNCNPNIKERIAANIFVSPDD